MEDGRGDEGPVFSTVQTSSFPAGEDDRHIHQTFGTEKKGQTIEHDIKVPSHPFTLSVVAPSIWPY